MLIHPRRVAGGTASSESISPSHRGRFFVGEMMTMDLYLGENGHDVEATFQDVEDFVNKIMDFNGSTVRKIEFGEDFGPYILLGFYHAPPFKTWCWGSVLLQGWDNGTTTLYPQLILENIREFSTNDNDYEESKALYQGQLDKLVILIIEKFGQLEAKKAKKATKESWDKLGEDYQRLYAEAWYIRLVMQKEYREEFFDSRRGTPKVPYPLWRSRVTEKKLKKKSGSLWEPGEKILYIVKSFGDAGVIPPKKRKQQHS